MLQVEDVPTRKLLVREMARGKGAAATAVLATRALMDVRLPLLRRMRVLRQLQDETDRDFLDLLDVLRHLRVGPPRGAERAVADYPTTGLSVQGRGAVDYLCGVARRVANRAGSRGRIAQGLLRHSTGDPAGSAIP
jgi:hypothetical protein